MEMTWDLSVLYSGYDDPKYSSDYEKLLKLIEKAKNEKLDLENPVQTIENNLKTELELSSLISELFSYSSLRTATNVNDCEALGQMGKIRLALQETVSADVMFTKFLKDLDLDALAQESELIKEHLYKLKRNQKNAMHMLSDKEEVLASKLQLVGSSSWGELQNKLTSNMAICVEGIEGTYPLSAVRNMAFSADANLRKAAYEAEIKAYKFVEDAVAMALNNIKREVNIMMPLRGYASGLGKTLEQSRMSETTLNAMIEAIKEDLTEEELAVFKRGRNAKAMTRAKNATMSEYRRATGFEALMGYLYLKGDMERMIELIHLGVEKVEVTL